MNMGRRRGDAGESEKGYSAEGEEAKASSKPSLGSSPGKTVSGLARRF